jgi:hypothetical protein
MIKICKSFTPFIVFLASIQFVSAQSNRADSANFRLTEVNNNGMLVLGAWAATNLATGVYGDLKADDEAKYFHQMNWMWNTVNASLVAISFISNRKQKAMDMTNQSVMNRAEKYQKAFLINAGLDMIYMGVGSALIARSRSGTERADQFAGYGKSLIMQGGFLMLFDLGMFAVNRKQEQRLKVNDSACLQLLPNGVRLRF